MSDWNVPPRAGNAPAVTAVDLLASLVAENTTLIVAFAKARRESGMDIREAVMAGTARRYRPVVMRAFAFILAVVPLVIATGAGAGSRRSIGTTVFGGMPVGTIVGLLVIPVLDVLVQSVRERVKGCLSGAGP